MDRKAFLLCHYTNNILLHELRHIHGFIYIRFVDNVLEYNYDLSTMCLLHVNLSYSQQSSFIKPIFPWDANRA
ncbi:hypothetical protein BX666DRAFT_1933269 [Dichotomocladium elegans]|nr:hypothetical protein BX666DRAFT_1933269 [Dichotomocladium elegans]